MKRLFGKLIIFFISFFGTYIILYQAIDYYYNNDFYDKDSIYIWGDSQAYQDVDLKILSRISNKNIYTSAHHGAGVYDFLVFTDQVKEGSTVIISFPKLALMRPKIRDYNNSGMSMKALRILYQNNYSFTQIKQIFLENLKPKANIYNSTVLYPLEENIKVFGLVSKIENSYDSSINFLDDKFKIYLEGINNLKAKNCKINIIQFPYHQELIKVENNNGIIRNKFSGYVSVIKQNLNINKVNEIKLKSKKEIFKDATHLNKLGARLLAKELYARLILKNDKKYTFSIFY